MVKNAIWLPGYQVMDEALQVEDGIPLQRFLVECPTTVEACPKCGVIGSMGKHGTEQPAFRDIPSFGHRVIIDVKLQRYCCRECGATAKQPLLHMDSRRHMTDRCVKWIAKEGVPETFCAVARRVGVDQKTVRNICIPDFRRRLAERTIGGNVQTPIILGIDELHLDGEARAIFIDVGRSRVLDILPGCKKHHVARWLWDLKDRQLIQIVTIDMTGHYREVVQKLLPQATIIIDKFHILRAADDAFRDARARHRKETETSSHARGGLYLMRTHPERLDERQERDLRGDLLNRPIVAAGHTAKEAFYGIWKAKDRTEAECLFAHWAANIPPLAEPEFRLIANMVERWRAEIFPYFDFAATNATTEGRNSMVKTIYRLGRGYSFDVIRAKAILAPPIEGRECPMCKLIASPAKFANARRFVPSENDHFDEDVCGSCHYLFHKMYVPFISKWDAASAGHST